MLLKLPSGLLQQVLSNILSSGFGGHYNLSNDTLPNLILYSCIGKLHFWNTEKSVLFCFLISIYLFAWNAKTFYGSKRVLMHTSNIWLENVAVSLYLIIFRICQWHLSLIVARHSNHFHAQIHLIEGLWIHTCI